jgi:hypothetical protein
MPQTRPENKPREWVTAAASRDTVPRVGLIPSTFAGSEEMDGRKIRALARPAPLDAPLDDSQLDDMFRLAVELGGGRRGGLVTAIGRDDWVVVKTACGRPAGASLLRSLLRLLAEHKLGRRFTAFEDASCQAGHGPTLEQMAKLHPKLRFERSDAATAPALEMPVEGRVFATKNPKGVYRVPRVLRECDKVISIAPLATRPVTGVALSMMNYLGFSPDAGAAQPGEAAVDIFSFHPADYAILYGSGGDRTHNVIIAGTNAPAVDAVGAAVMGLDSTAIRHLDLAVQHGYGINDAYSIWTRGAEIDEVKADFRRPA